MPASKLRVRARSGLPTDFDAAAQGLKRVVAHRYVPDENAPNKWAFAPMSETVEISNRVEHRALVKDGALWAADEATARECFGADWRRNFDASFGTAPSAPTTVTPATAPTEPAPAPAPKTGDKK